MRLPPIALSIFIVLSPSVLFAQDLPSSSASPSTSSPSVSLPRLIPLNGVFRPGDAQPVGQVETVTFAIYADETGGTPLWQETQQVKADAEGRYGVLLGATQPEGVPLEVFASGEARWLEMQWSRGDARQGRRARLTFVPYAVHASDADTLGGKPASAYALSAGSPGGPAAAGGSTGDSVSSNTVLPGGTNLFPKYTNSTDLTPSTVSEVGGRVGVGTAAPTDYVHVQFTDNSGGFTGYAVQNLGSGAAAYSGTLFYDQAGVLGQFQGFNNSTHEYRINNIAKNVSNAFNGTINFMIGGSSKFFVGSGGNIGIGTSTPAALLEVNNGSSTNQTTFITGVTFNSANSGGTLISGRRYRGTPAAPTAVLNNDVLVNFRGTGYTGAGIGSGGANITIRADENWAPAAQGASIGFFTTPTGTATTFEQMRLTPDGKLGLGTTTPQNAIDIVRFGDAFIQSSSYGAAFGASAGMFATTARGTPQTPAAIQSGDFIGGFLAGGHDGTTLTDPQGGMGVFATENWTSIAHGAATGFLATPLGAVDAIPYVAIWHDGKVGVDMPLDVNGTPTPAVETLQVFGNIRVGTSGTNGCLKDFSGTVIVGTCSSDVRLKKNITPFTPALDKLTSLQPVHYFWRADEFPERHFGNAEAAGLIAQDVEKVLPELVETEKDGFKAVNYSRLPLLTIQAMKELKTENDALKQRVVELGSVQQQQTAELDSFKQRVADLERLLTELRTAIRR